MYMCVHVFPLQNLKELFRKANAEGKYSLAKPGRPYWQVLAGKAWISMTARQTPYPRHVFSKKGAPS